MFWGEGETTLFEALMLLCTDAANGLMLLMLLNQNQDQLADFSIAFCSSTSMLFMRLKLHTVRTFRLLVIYNP